jgi:hypothetical protein
MSLTPQEGLALFNAIATAGKTVYEIAQGVTKIETKQQLMEVYDTLINLKRAATDLEDENRDLKAKLRFKQDEYEFRNPFWYDKQYPDRPLCPKCFSKQIAAPVGAPFEDTYGTIYRRCLTCDALIEEGRRGQTPHTFRRGI